MKESIRNKLHTALTLAPAAVVSAILIAGYLLFLSYDSPCYEVWGRIDTSWYFTAGKSWMKGMTPYVDFTDSKGPLLWLIYGCGYLISHFDYVGVWIISIFFYLAAFWTVYATARLFVKSRWYSFLVAVIMTVVFLNPFLHDETRTEDYSQPFIAIAMWAMCRNVYRPASRESLRRGAWLVGIAMGATLMMKFTIAMMIGYCALALCFVAWRGKKDGVWSVAWRAAVGMGVVCLPFVALFAVKGNLPDFISEYFLFTTRITASRPHLNVAAWVLRGGQISHIIIIMTLSTAAFLVIDRRKAWVPVAAFYWFLLITMQNAQWSYYYKSMMIFAEFGLIALAAACERRLNNRWAKCAATALCLALMGNIAHMRAVDMENFKYARHTTHLYDQKRIDYYRHVSLVGRVKEPRIVFLNTNNVVNVGDETGGVAGCKYFAKQFGAEGVDDVQWRDIQVLRPHFVYVHASDPKNRRRMESLGYFKLMEPGEFFHVTLYAEPSLRHLYP